MKNITLSNAQRSHYLENGFLVIDNIIPDHITDALMTRANELVESADLTLSKTVFSTKTNAHVKNKYFLESGNEIRYFLEEKAVNEQGDLLVNQERAINKIGHAMHTLDPLFSCFSHAYPIMKIANDINIINPVILQSMYIFKQPRIGGEVNCHQDATYLYLKNQTITGFWFALEDATIENGCLWGIPGGHKGNLKSRMIRDQEDNIRIDHYDSTPFDLNAMIPLEVKKGSMIVLHGLFPHMSKENCSAASRHAYAIHVASGDGDFAEDNWIRR